MALAAYSPAPPYPLQRLLRGPHRWLAVGDEGGLGTGDGKVLCS